MSARAENGGCCVRAAGQREKPGGARERRGGRAGMGRERGGPASRAMEIKGIERHQPGAGRMNLRIQGAGCLRRTGWCFLRVGRVRFGRYTAT
jgi:hypothetical protein